MNPRKVKKCSQVDFRFRVLQLAKFAIKQKVQLNPMQERMALDLLWWLDPTPRSGKTFFFEFMLDFMNHNGNNLTYKIKEKQNGTD